MLYVAEFCYTRKCARKHIYFFFFMDCETVLDQSYESTPNRSVIQLAYFLKRQKPQM